MKSDIEKAWDAFAKWIKRLDHAKAIDNEYPLNHNPELRAKRWQYNTRPVLIPASFNQEEFVKPCPNPEICVLTIEDGKLWCETHNRFLEILSLEEEEALDKSNIDWQASQLTLRHVMYTAYAVGVEGKVLIDADQ